MPIWNHDVLNKAKRFVRLFVLFASMTLLMAPVNATQRLACIGDSLTFMSPARAQRGYPIAIEARSISGSSRAVGVFAVDSTTSISHVGYWNTNVRSKGYTHVAVLSGVNDIITGVAQATTRANIQEIIDEATTDGMTVLLLTLVPWSTNTDSSAPRQTATLDHNAWLATKASASVKIVDVYTGLGTPGTPSQLLAAYDSGDGLHFNDAGSAAIADLVLAQL